MAARKTGAATKPTGGTKSKDKGTRGGRPEATAATTQRPGARPAGNGNGSARTGNGQAKPGGAKPGSQAARARAAQAAAVAEQPAPRSGPPSWLQWTTWVLALGGLGVSIYLTIVHYSTAVTLACPDTGTINCEKVVTSPQSIIFGIPVAVYGLAFYVFLAAANSPWAWRASRPVLPWKSLSSQPALYWVRLASMIVGIVFVLYLIYTELFTIKAICLWCTSVHVITFILFVLVVFTAAAGYGTTQSTSQT